MKSWIVLILAGMLLTLAWGQGMKGSMPGQGAGGPVSMPMPQQTPQPAQAAPPAATATPRGTVEVQLSSEMPVLNLQNASLTEVIDILARNLKINYILDPRVHGGVTLQTYGEIKPVNPRAMLETILRINGAAMVQVGDIYRIVPMGASVAQLPLSPQVDAKTFPDDERIMLNLVFLKYSTAGELSKLLQPFLGEGAQMTVYEPANLLLLLDNSRNMRRTMELIALFDSDTLAGQRVRLFEVKHGRPRDIAKELETVLQSISLGDKASVVKFLAVDRINTVVAIASNPGAFKQVEEWLKKLDIPQKATAGALDNYVYRVNYGMAQSLAGVIMQLYLGTNFPGMGGYGMGGSGMGGSGMGGYGMGGSGMGGYGMGGSGMGGYGMGGSGMGGSGMNTGYGMGGGYGMNSGYGMGGGYGGAGAMSAPMSSSTAQVLGVGQSAGAGLGAAGSVGAAAGQQDLTGSYLAAGAGAASAIWAKIPHVIPNPFDNTLLIQATPQDYAQILKILEQLDVPPRQILVEAKIYEVELTGSFSLGVQSALQTKDQAPPTGIPGQAIRAAADSTGLTMTAGLLVGNSRRLLAMLTASESTGRTKLVSAPSLIATDSIPAMMNVGSEVPTLSAQAVNGGITSGGSSVFTQSIQNQSTGVTLNVLARANPSGIITMMINQDVSAPVPPASGAAIQSPSFSNRSVQTQVTLRDGDTIAIAGIILETKIWGSSGIPLLHRIPLLGAAFGSKSYSTQRTEMVIFMTPRVIYDTNQLVEASDELKSGFKRLTRLIHE